MKVLCLEVEREHVGKQDVERTGDIAHGIGFEISWRVKRRHPPRFCIRVHRFHLSRLRLSRSRYTARAAELEARYDTGAAGQVPASVYSAVTISFNCGIVSGPKIFRGGWSNVTRP